MPRLALAPVAALALATACAEDPSFVLRWRVGRDAAAAESDLVSVRQCSELGISRVRITTATKGTNELVDSREYPCFPDEFSDPDGAVGGPEVGPGEYDVTITALTRRDVERPSPDKQQVTVKASGEGQLITSHRLLSVGECEDGIDNDRDGGTDNGDLACRQGQPRESLDNNATIFTFQATLLGGNPVATCAGLGISQLRVTLDGDTKGAQTIPCTTILQSFSAYLPPGDHSWSVAGLDQKGTAVTDEITGADADFSVSEQGYAFVEIAVDLDLASFPDPFNDPLRFSVEYEPYPNAPVNRPCDASGLDLGVLTLGATRLTLLDEAGKSVATVTLADAPMGADADFPIDGLCVDFDRVRTTSPLMWSDTAGQRDYSLVIETWAAADDPMTAKPCFSNAAAPVRLAPGISPAIVVPRTRSDGNCADCSSDNDCSICEDGVCKR
jgi:hypothetical protein